MNILCINLKSRLDRKTHAIKELEKLNKTLFSGYTIYDAHKSKRYEHKALGCNLSHIGCLQYAAKENWPMVLICEDDITFTNVPLFESQLSAFLDSKIEWDVILIAGNNFQPYNVINETCIRVLACQTTTGYIVKREYYSTLESNFKESYTLLKNNRHKYSIYAMDKWWFSLQREHNWYLIIPLTIIQYTNYSNILEKNVDYTVDMLSLK